MIEDTTTTREQGQDTSKDVPEGGGTSVNEPATTRSGTKEQVKGVERVTSRQPPRETDEPSPAAGEEK